MKHRTRKIQITVYDNFTLSPKEKEVYHAILRETILKNTRCAQLSLADLEEMTGIKRNTIDFQLKKLVKRRLIEIDKKQKTNTICIITTYKEYYRL